MSRLQKVLIAFVAVGIVIVCAGYFLLRNGLAADNPPGAIETAVARRIVVLSIPASAREQTNPHAKDADTWREGAGNFAQNCAMCHGRDGRGSTDFAQRMYPPVPNLAAPEIQALSDGALFAVIQHGVRWTGMPAFRSAYTLEQTWQLVSFIRRLPTLSPQDYLPTEPQNTRPGTVTMDGTSFRPGELTVHVGETVTWVNQDPFPHDVTSTSGGFMSGALAPDQQWQFRPTRPGRFPYVCTLHPGMKGTVVVTP